MRRTAPGTRGSSATSWPSSRCTSATAARRRSTRARRCRSWHGSAPATTRSSCTRCWRCAQSPTGDTQDADAELAEIEQIAEGGTGLVRWHRHLADRPRRVAARARRARGRAGAAPRVRRADACPRVSRDRRGPASSPGFCSARRRRSRLTPTTPAPTRISPTGRRCSPSTRDHAVASLTADNVHLDFPVAGLLAFGLGAWAHLRDAAPVREAARLLDPRRVLRLQPHDPIDDVGADRPRHRGGRPRPARPLPRHATASGARRSCSTRARRAVEQLPR